MRVPVTVHTLAAQHATAPDVTSLCGHGTHARRTVGTYDGRTFTVFNAADYAGTTNSTVYCPGDDPVSRTVEATGKWEFHVTDTAVAVLSSGRPGIMIDAGSCIGWFSGLAAFHGRDVLAVEMVAEFADMTRTNLAGYDVDSAVVQCFVNAATPPVTVDEPVVLLKVDTEGAEQYVVRVFDQAFRDGLIRYAILEVSPVFNDSYPPLIRRLFGYGYSCWRIAPDGGFHMWTEQNVDAAIAEFTQCDVIVAAPGMPVLW